MFAQIPSRRSGSDLPITTHLLHADILSVFERVILCDENPSRQHSADRATLEFLQKGIWAKDHSLPVAGITWNNAQINYCLSAAKSQAPPQQLSGYPRTPAA